MEQSSFCICGDTAYSFAGRLSFPQLLLVLSCVLIESSLPSRVGDRRQLHDVVYRKERDWRPLIGSEGFHEMKQRDWRAATPEIHRLWGSVRGFMIQQRLCALDTSSEDLREHLCRLLCRVEQISAQGLNALCIPRPNLLSLRAPLDSMTNLVLVCVSLSVVSTPCRNVPLTWEADRRILDEILIYLCEQPLFPCEISSEQLKSTLSSLEMLFSREPDNVSDCIPESPLPEQSQTAEFEPEKRDTQMQPYDYFSIQDTGSILWCRLVRPTNCTEVEVGIGYAEGQKQLFLNWK